MSERNNGGGLVNGGGREEDLSELVFIKSEPPKPKPVDPNSTDDAETSVPAAAAAPITFNNTKVYYRCATCGRLVTSMGNRKHKLRLHLRSKYHRLRAKATAEALDTDLVRIVANLRANNVHCLELRGGGNNGINGGDGGDGNAKDNPTTSSSASGAIKAPIQLYCNICEAELLTRKSSNIRRHLESRAHRRSAQLVAEYVPMDSTTFHFELVQWLTDHDIPVDRLGTMRPFLERHCRRRILEPATLKRDFLPYVLAAASSEKTENASGQENSGAELPKGPLKKRAVQWLRDKKEQQLKEAAAKAAKAQKEAEEKAAAAGKGGKAKAAKRRKKTTLSATTSTTKTQGVKRKLPLNLEEEAANACAAALISTSTLEIKGNPRSEEEEEEEAEVQVAAEAEQEGESSAAVMAILEEGIDYEVVQVEQMEDGVTRAVIKEIGSKQQQLQNPAAPILDLQMVEQVELVPQPEEEEMEVEMEVKPSFEAFESLAPRPVRYARTATASHTATTATKKAKLGA